MHTKKVTSKHVKITQNNKQLRLWVRVLASVFTDCGVWEESQCGETGLCTNFANRTACLLYT
jgi:hypothetical protein